MLNLLLILLLAGSLAADEEFWDVAIGSYKNVEQVDDERLQLRAKQIQCTRRFSPGRCLEEVKPVWTYSFHLQTCTERLGCRQPTATNRFLSYRLCMETCQSLINIYNHILSQLSVWNGTERWEQERAIRRGGEESEESFAEEIQPEEDEEPQSRYHSRDLYLASSFEEREDLDRVHLAEVLPPNIDYQAPDFTHYDPIHRPRHVV